MPIDDYGDIAGWVVSLDTRTATPNTTTGAFDASTIADDAGAATVLSNTHAPKYNGDGRPGFIGVLNQECNGSRTGVRAVLASGATNARRMLVVACVTPGWMIGDGASGAGRIFTTDGPFAALFKAHRNGAGGNFDGILTCNGGGSGENTIGINGGERQIVAWWCTFAGGAYGYCNRDGSENATPANGSNTAIGEIHFGARSAGSGGNTNSPFVGVTHEAQAFQLSTGGHTESEVLDAMAYMAERWDVDPSPYVAVWFGCGDSNLYGAGVLWETQVNTGLNARSTTTTGAVSATGTSFASATSPAGWTTGTRIVIDHGLPTAEVLVISSITGAGPYTINHTTTPYRFAHGAGASVSNDYYGYSSPYCQVSMLTPSIGDGSGLGHFNYGTPGAQLHSGTTALNGAHAAGSTTLTVTNSSGFAAGQYVWIDFDTVDQELVRVTAVPGGGATLTVTATTIDHDSASTVEGVPNDGSLHLLDHSQFASMDRYYDIQRGTNDGPGGRSAAQMLRNFRMIGQAARLRGATHVIGWQVPPRIPNTYNATYTSHNANLDALLASDEIDAVVGLHWMLMDPANSGSITYPGSTGATAIIGLMYDPLGVHPKHCGMACWALMRDKAQSRVTGIPVGYAPSTPSITAERVGSSNIVTWTRPSSPDAPRMYAYSSAITSECDAPSGLVVRVLRNGNLIATVAPAGVNTIDGSVDWTGRLSYTDSSGSIGDNYSVYVEDAAGNTSSSASASIAAGGAPSRMIRGLLGQIPKLRL